MRIVIAGGSGFLGRRLAAHWLAAGAEVWVLSRAPQRARRRLPESVTMRPWQPPRVDDDLIETLRGADAVVNLAGTPIGGRPWTPGRMHAIRQSRLDATGALVEALHLLPEADRPHVLVNASGIDVYGDRLTGELAETASPGDSFLAGVVADWERAAAAATELGVRVVTARTAMIVAPEALAWRLVLLPFRLFVGGRLGSGRQRFTWLHVDDAVGLYDLAVHDPSIHGPLNMVAPAVPSQAELAQAIGRAMRRPAVFPVPAALLRLVLWGQADIVLHGRVAVPAKALAAGYAFRFPTIDSALRDVLRQP
jgi:uncharacterized protein (TIGR01777 family)